MTGYIDIGRSEGATVAFAGTTPTDPALAGGYFVAPTIFESTSNDLRIAQEEIFGPVATVIPFDNVDEVVQLANASPYGLAAAIWARHRRAHHREGGAPAWWINDSQPAPTEGCGAATSNGVGREPGHAPTPISRPSRSTSGSDVITASARRPVPPPCQPSH